MRIDREAARLIAGEMVGDHARYMGNGQYMLAFRGTRWFAEEPGKLADKLAQKLHKAVDEARKEEVSNEQD